jgi:hypothetical protein
MTAHSFTMKLARADGHLRALDDAVAEFLATEPYEIVREYAGDQFIARVVYRHQPPDGLLMLTGDAVHNLRSALDHLAWSLAGESADRGTEFPIFIDQAKFRDKGRTKMRGMPSQAQKIIKSLQPYKRPHGLPEEKDPLWLLQSLDIEDKHRTLNLVASGVMGRLHISTSMDHPEFGLTGATGFMPFADGAVILRIPAPRDRSRLRDCSSYTFDVAFDPKGPAGGVGLREGLRDMRESVAEAIRLLEPLIP